MKSFKYIRVLLILLGIATASMAERVKLAQTGFQFLSVKSDARAAAMADAMTSVENHANSLFYNPAGMARTPHRVDFAFSMNNWIVDIKHTAVGLTCKPAGGAWGVLGVSLQYVDYGDVEGTMNWSNSQGYVDTEIFNPSAMAIGVGYAYAINDRFSVGGQVKMAKQSLGKSVVPSLEGAAFDTQKNLAEVLAYDFGTLFRTGVKSLVFGMSVRNFSEEIQYEEESFPLPLIFTLGISANLLDFIGARGIEHALLVSIDATHPRSHREQVKLGLEYEFMKTFAFRAGYIHGNDEENISFGFGINRSGLAFNYAYTPFGIFDSVQRISCRLSL